MMVGSLLLPWYQSPVSSDLVQTGFGAFSLAEGALVLVAAATTFLALQAAAATCRPGRCASGRCSSRRAPGRR